MKKLVILSLLIFIMSIGCVSASDDINATDTISLDDNLMSADDVGDYEELQNLIDDAEDGSKIELSKDYKISELINIEKDLEINGNGHYIDGDFKTAIFFIDANVVLENIKFYNANDEKYSGGAIYSLRSLGIFNCDFYDNYANHGGAIASYGSLYVYDSFFYNNMAGEYGACIFAENHVEIYNSYFKTENDGMEFIDYYDDDEETSGYLYLENNTMESPFMWSIWYEGDTPIESPTSLVFTELAFDSPEDMPIAFVFDDMGNSIIMDSINLDVYDSNNKLIDSTTVPFEWSNGGYAYTNFDLTPGKYRTTGSVDSDFASNCTVLEGTITILGDDEKMDSEVTASAQAAERQVTLTATVSPNSATGTVTFTFGGKSYTASVVNGTATKTVTDLDYGIYNVKTSYSGDDNYYSANAKDISFTISKAISAPSVEKYYGGPERFVVVLTGSDEKPIANANVKISINGQNYERTTDSTGTASMAINLPAGDYIADVEYDGEKISSSVKVKPTLEGNDLTKMFRNASQYYIKVLDSNGKALSGQKVKFNINGVFYERDINASGIARLNINIEPGTYVITAENPSNGEMFSNTITVKPIILENYDLTKYYRNDSQYIIKILDAQGNPAKAGVSVQFNINGVFYTRQSDATGHVRMNINLQPGDYVITAIYNEMMVSNKVKVLNVLSGKDIVMEYKDGTRYEATLLDGQGKPYAGQNIKFNINGVFYDRETDANGVARLNINLDSGQYIITAMYNDYGISNTITINPKLIKYDCGNGHSLEFMSTVRVDEQSVGLVHGYEIYYPDGYAEFSVESTSDSVSDYVIEFVGYGAVNLGYHNGWVMLDWGNVIRQYGLDLPNYVGYYKDGYLYGTGSDDLNILKRTIEAFK